MKPYIKITLFVVFFIALIGILAALYFYNLKPKDLQKVKPDFVVTATDLQKAFEENERASSIKYIGKIIEVSGEIASVSPGEKNTLNISFKTGSDISAVICTLLNVSNTSRFAIGTRATIKGECSGFLMDVLLNNCVVAENPK
jgi:tRNA_anti-like